MTAGPTPVPNPRSDDEQLSSPPTLIFSYSRAQAIADGVLFDVTETAREAGFTMPVALTAAVMAEYVRVPAGVIGQNEAGRLWDVVRMCAFGIKLSKLDGPEILFKLHVRNDNSDEEPPIVTLKAVCGPGDSGEPVITIMEPEES